MRNLTTVFLSTAPSRFKLPFGVNKNVVLKSIDNETRRDKNGIKLNKNCFMTFASLDPEDEDRYIAQTTFNYFNIDKPAYATKSFIHQFNQMLEILKAVVPKDKLGKAAQKFQKALSDDADLFVKLASGEETSTKAVKGVAALQTKVVEVFIEIMTPFLDKDGDKVDLVVITDAKGIFFDLPREDKGFIAKSSDNKALTIDAKYARWYAEKDVKKTDKADDIGGEAMLDEEEVMVEDDDLDGI